MDLNVKHDLDRLIRQFDALSRDEITKSIRLALDRTGDQARTEASRTIRKEYNFKAREVRQTFSIRRARAGTLDVVIRSRGRRVPLIDMAARQKPRGVQVRVTRQAKLIPGTFIQRMPNGKIGVFERKGKDRNPIRQLFTIAIPEAFAGQKVREATMAKIREVFPRRLQFELERALRRLNR